ncbi:hypothetical protein DVH05_010229 [Phytophthora capsici]|nr:hypothetical protein DVH05_010229 [Phytophthora capsici]
MTFIYMTTRSCKHSRAKHIENKLHVSHLVEKKQLDVDHVVTNDMVADITTTTVGSVKVARFRKALKMLSPKEMQKAYTGT